MYESPLLQKNGIGCPQVPKSPLQSRRADSKLLSRVYALELFYRLNLTKQFTITPDIQFIKDPALNPTEDSIWVLGFRARLAI